MQTYLEYNLLRLFQKSVKIVFFVLASVLTSHLSLAIGLGEGEMVSDTLYRNWNQDKSTFPYFSYELKNFEDSHQRSETEELVRIYGIGGIYINNGSFDEVAEWIKDLNNKADIEPIIFVKMDKVFELPFTFYHKQSSQVQIECLTNQSLIQDLIHTHAVILKIMGVDVVHFEHLPQYYHYDEQERVIEYIQGLHDEGLTLSFGKGCDSYLNRIGWSEIGWLSKSSVINDVSKTKNNKEKIFRNRTGYKGLITDELDQVSFYLDKYNQLNQGYNALKLPRQFDPNAVIKDLIQHESNNKSVVKKAVKEYYKHWFDSKRVQESDSLGFIVNAFKEISNSIDRASIILLKDSSNAIPIADLANRHFYSFFEKKQNPELFQTIDRYVSHSSHSISKLALPLDFMINGISTNSTFIVDMSSVHRQVDIDGYMSVLGQLKENHEVIILYQGDRSNLNHFDLEVPILWSPKVGAEHLELMIQTLFGVYPIAGKLANYIDDDAEPSFQRKSLNRLAYGLIKPESLNAEKFKEIDELVALAIQDEVFPGCQIMMIKDGCVVYDKSHGYLTYDSIAPVRWDHIYDIASITKIVAMVPMVMKAIANEQLELESRLGDYLELFKKSDKSDLVLAKLLTHQSGLRSYIPFWRNASYSSDSAMFFYKNKRVSKELLKINWADSVNAWIAGSTYNNLKQADNTYRYLYSDLGFMIMKGLVEKQNDTSLDVLVDSLLYQPMGMNMTTFNPINRFDVNQIVPTSLEPKFRKRLLRGEVHDKNTALIGGVSGHAGLFSNTNDLGKYMQMMLQGGEYGGKTYFDLSLVTQFTSKPDSTSNRGLGWDKPRFTAGNISKHASRQAFGHSGFTGGLIWADPQYDMVYVFLSNRVYPDSDNRKLMKQNIRMRIHDLMYESFLPLEEEGKQY